MATVLWAASFFLNATLVFVLILKRRYRTVPCFTVWIASYCVYSIVLFFAYRSGSKHAYFLLYWGTSFLDLLLQVAVVFEIAAIVLRRSGGWVEGARLRLGLLGATAPVIAFGMASFMMPAAETKLDAWDARASLFTTVLICVLFSAVMLVSQQLGVSWRELALREGYGLTVWALVAFITDTLHAYWRTAEHFSALEHVRMAFYLGSLIYWTVVFWVGERAVAPTDLATRKKLEKLRSGLEYGRVD